MVPKNFIKIFKAEKERAFLVFYTLENIWNYKKNIFKTLKNFVLSLK